MKSFERTALIWYSPRQMYDLVADVAAYPAFLPGCRQVDILQSDPGAMLVRMTIEYMGLNLGFTTQAILDPGKSLSMKLVDGPFSSFEGNWTFSSPASVSPAAASAAGPQAPEGCHICFVLNFDFSSRLLEASVSPVIGSVAGLAMDAFVERAEALYDTEKE